jgi:hypothetical protein
MQSLFGSLDTSPFKISTAFFKQRRSPRTLISGSETPYSDRPFRTPTKYYWLLLWVFTFHPSPYAIGGYWALEKYSLRCHPSIATTVFMDFFLCSKYLNLSILSSTLNRSPTRLILQNKAIFKYIF